MPDHDIDSRFWIGFVSDELDEDELLHGRLLVGRSRDGFYAGVDLWSEAEYVEQWREGLLRLRDGAATSCLITDATGIVGLYALYHEGLRLRVFERILILREDHDRFSLDDPYSIVRPLQTHNDEGQSLLIWECDFGGVLRFLDDGGPQLAAERMTAVPG